jgi:hypothetical protein
VRAGAGLDDELGGRRGHHLVELDVETTDPLQVLVTAGELTQRVAGRIDCRAGSPPVRNFAATATSLAMHNPRSRA